MASRISVQSIPSLKQFIVHSQSLALYRKALRLTTHLELSQRKEIRDVIRYEFESCRNVTDPQNISYLLTTGKRRVEQLQLQLAMAKS